MSASGHEWKWLSLKSLISARTTSAFGARELLRVLKKRVGHYRRERSPAARFSMAKGSVTGIRLSARPNLYEGQQGQLLRSSVIDWRLRPLLSASFATTSVLAPHRNARARTV